jgi:hypothetical protein
MDQAERELMASSVARAVADEAHDLDEALAKLGWGDALAVDPRSAITVLFEAQGAANRTSAALEQVLVGALGADPTVIGAVFPPLGQWHAPGRIEGDRVAIRGLGGPGLAGRRAVAVLASGRDGFDAGLAPTAALELSVITGLDPWLGLVGVTGSLPATAWDRAAVEPDAAVAWARAVARAQLALGHELLGASRRVLALAREHAVERIQFGRPISTFQAVRHRLADTLVAIETGEAALAAAWDDGTPEAAAIAKALTGRGARTAGRHGQQVLAGIGFTTEHPLHRYVRRILVLDQLFGSSRALTKDLGEELLRRRKLPPLTPL